MTEFLIFLPFYLLPFAALFLLHRGRWLAGGATLGLLALAVLFGLLSRTSGEGWLGVYIALCVAAFGSVMGRAARFVLIMLGERGEKRGVAAAVMLAFLVGAPLLYATWSRAKQEASRRRYAGPSPACMAGLHVATLGDRRIQLPLDEGSHVGEGRGFKPVAMFAIREQARVFCERTARSALRVTNVQIEFARRGSAPPHHRPPCDRPRAGAWWPLLCRFEQDPAIYLYSMTLFDSRRFDSDRVLPFPLPAAGSAPATAGPRWRADGPFMRRDSDRYFYLSRAASPGLASPFTAICSRDYADGLRC